MIGESPPANGTFFYAGDSNLYRYTRAAFEAELGTSFESSEQFLKFFRRSGWHLEDLSQHPINRLDRRSRRAAWSRAVSSLACRIERTTPRAIVVVPRRISVPVFEALRQAGLHTVMRFDLAFPTMGHQQRYVRELRRVIQTLRLQRKKRIR
jgi:hypothetical protein